MEKPDFPLDLAWHFAHETAHLHQRQTSTESGDEWITEGAAEALAAMALRADASAYVQSAEEKALGKCRELLKGRSVRETIAAGTFDAAYSCGMLINLAIDSKVRLATKHDGLYAVWRNYRRRASNSGSVVSRAAYLEAVSDVGGADLAEWIQKAVRAGCEHDSWSNKLVRWRKPDDRRPHFRSDIIGADTTCAARLRTA
jgi:hypothetical protein